MTKQYEPFDLERALAGEPVVLRDGSKAFVRHFEKDLRVESHQQLVGFLESGGRGRSLLSWDKGGFYFGSDSKVDQDIIGMYPQYKLIHGVKVPTFRNWIPDIGDMVYVVRLELSIPLEVKEWRGTPRDMCALERGLVYPHTMRGHKAARLLAKTLVAVIQE